MTFDGALVAAGWSIALVFSVAGGAVGLLWSTTAIERWLDEAGKRQSPEIESSGAEHEPASPRVSRAA